MPDSVDCRLLGTLLSDHGSALELFAAQWSDSPEDCVQEAFIELARQPAAPHNATAWLYRVVRNRAISMARSGGRRQRYEALAARMRLTCETVEEPLIELPLLVESLEMLEDSWREVLIARIWGKLSFEQIGEAAGVSTSTAYRHYVSALRALRERWGVTCTSEKPMNKGSAPQPQPRQKFS